jgi:uncharacterized protein YbjT (DUF2867 family)
MRVLVTAAHGNQGRLLVPLLAREGVAVRALHASTKSAAPLKALGAAEVITADAAERLVLDRAMNGIDAVYYVGPNAHAREREMGIAAVDAAVAAAVGHFVYSSVLHPQLSAIEMHRHKLAVEEHLLESGLNTTILHPAHYMQTLQVRHAIETGVFLLTWSLDLRQSLIDCADIADVAAKVLREGAAHFGATYELSGADYVTAHEIASTIAAVAGRPVRAEEVTTEQVVVKLFPGIVRDAEFARRIAMFDSVGRWYSAHAFRGNPRVATWLLGRAPRSLADYVTRVA